MALSDVTPFGVCPLRANTGQSRTDTSPISALRKRAGNFFPKPLLFFLESFSQIPEKEQKMGRMLFSQATF
jgi:hypothetical protein